MAINLFTYGSLMFEPVWQRVVGNDYTSQPARVYGYRRHAIQHEVYPAVVRDDESFVQGVLYRALGEADLQRLDLFEGELYQRLSTAVELADGEIAMAFIYALKDEYAGLLDETDWNEQQFEHEGIKIFFNEYRGFE